MRVLDGETCNTGPGNTHWVGCKCHEERLARQIAEAEALAETYRKALQEIADGASDCPCVDDARAALGAT